jgi:AraC-like DNA-binding protein
MEFINRFIYLKITANAHFDYSFCETTQDENYIFLTFGILSNDCLFDLADNSYEFQIRISKIYLEKYNEDLDLNIEKQTICCNIQSKLLEIINCKLTGIQRKIFLESHILFLLYQSQKVNLIFQSNCDSCSILDKSVDIDKIHRARKFILDNLSGNITIPVIASSIGTNQCYLKKGFKEVYNQTIFEFIQENRMIKAKHLLQSTNPIITDIAHNMGYASLSSFSQAYKNYFGISPTHHTKNHFTNN